MIRSGVALAVCVIAPIAFAQTTAQTAPQSDTSYIDSNGTAHITRVIPVPTTISPEAQAVLARPASDAAHPESLADRRGAHRRLAGPRRSRIQGRLSGKYR